MDKLDYNIIECLNRDARKSFREVAKELGISAGTAYNRIRKLEGQGIIKGYIPMIDAGKVGFDLFVIIGIKIAHGKLVEVEKKLTKDPRVYGVYDVTGEWDSIILARFRNREELNEFIKSVLATENVERTYTQVVLNVLKDEKRVILGEQMAVEQQKLKKQ